MTNTNLSTPSKKETLSFISHLIKSKKYSNREILDLTKDFTSGKIFSSY